MEFTDKDREMYSLDYAEAKKKYGSDNGKYFMSETDFNKNKAELEEQNKQENKHWVESGNKNAEENTGGSWFQRIKDSLVVSAEDQEKHQEWLKKQYEPQFKRAMRAGATVAGAAEGAMNAAGAVAEAAGKTDTAKELYKAGEDAEQSKKDMKTAAKSSDPVKVMNEIREQKLEDENKTKAGDGEGSASVPENSNKKTLKYIGKTETDKNARGGIEEEKDVQTELARSNINSQKDLNSLFKQYVQDEVGDDYRNKMTNFILDAYKRGDYGEPGSKTAKANAWYAVIDSIGTSLRNAGHIINKDGQYETPEWQKTQSSVLKDSIDRYNQKQIETQETMLKTMGNIVAGHVTAQQNLDTLMADTDLKRLLAKQGQSVQNAVAQMLVDFGSTVDFADLKNGLMAGLLSLTTSSTGAGSVTGGLSNSAKEVAEKFIETLAK